MDREGLGVGFRRRRPRLKLQRLRPYLPPSPPLRSLPPKLDLAVLLHPRPALPLLLAGAASLLILLPRLRRGLVLDRLPFLLPRIPPQLLRGSLCQVALRGRSGRGQGRSEPRPIRLPRRSGGGRGEEEASLRELDGLCGAADDKIHDLPACKAVIPRLGEALGLSEAQRELCARCVAVAFRNGFGGRVRSPFSEYYEAVIRRHGRGSQGHREAVRHVVSSIDPRREELERGDQEELDSRISRPFTAIFTLVAKLNHSCNPNAEIRIGGYVDAVCDVVALKDIKAGEQIFISYVGPGGGRTAKRKFSSQYLFVCSCDICRG